MRIASHARRIATRITTTRITTKMGLIRVAFAASVLCLVLGLVLAQPLGAAPRSSPSASQTPAQSGSQTSEARGECLSLPSRILARSIPYCVILPPGYAKEPNRRYPVLYYLHGLGDNEQMLLRSGGFDLVQELWDGHEIGEFIIVTPAGYASFFMNSRDGSFRYDDFFLQEFMPWIEKRYRTEAGRESRGIGGISMGGYGAVKIAIRHSDKYAFAAGISAALDAPRREFAPRRLGQSFRYLRIFGPSGSAYRRENDVFALAQNASSPPFLFLACGSDESLLGVNRSFAALLEKRGMPHEYHEAAGEHSWDFWKREIPEMLRSADQHLHSD